MKRVATTMACLVFLAITGLAAFAAEDKAAKVEFDTHDGYFVSNKFEPKSGSSFVALGTQAEFNKVFGAGFVMNDKAHRLPADAFKTKMVVSAIRRGKAMWTFTVDGVTSDGKTLMVKYTAKSTPHETAEFACPLIVSVPRGDYSAVEFIENGKSVKKLELGKAESKPAS